ncbi:AI-2E family transporter [Sphingomonas bacterium]|uniref:AI-2E family transporter n=1 Tax=Sphingomonas bacterium TaxID=1895847 RepID=UPI001575B49D|nr:AI-2E family transporter [Sphingomonas bacterium]
MAEDQREAPASLIGVAAPHEMRDPVVRRELTRAAVWIGLIGAVALAVILAEPLLMIFGGVVVAAMLDGGVRLLGRVLPIGRGWRLLIVVLGVTAFLLGTIALLGVQVTQQISQLAVTVQQQYGKAAGELSKLGLVPAGGDVSGLIKQAASQLGRAATWVGTAVGALTTLVFIVVLGVFFAMEPRIYERGLQWMIPTDRRENFAVTTERMGGTLRRLLAGRLIGMAAEGVMTGIALMIGGVPMSLVLGIIAGIMAFVPNIGAFITGSLMIAVGFSGGMHTGFWALGTWAVVQAFDGYVVVPIVARRTVDLPPALTLSMQILLSALFGVLGLMFADPMTAMIKVALERSAEEEAKASGDDPVQELKPDQR